MKHRNRGTTRTLERRTIRLAPAEVRASDEDANGLPRTFTAVVLRYNVLDDYRTKFDPDVFSESLGQRMPRVVWAHDWTDPIGRYTDVVRNDNDALELRGEFDEFEDVPSARRAARQLKSGTIDQFSVGFYVEEEEYDKDGDFYWIRKGDLVEASPVLSAAVPGTSLTGVRARRRSSGLLVPLEDVETIIVQTIAGNVGVAEALAIATDAAVEGPTGDSDDPSDDAEDDDDDDTPEPEETPDLPTASDETPEREPATVEPAAPPEENRPDPDPEPDADVTAAPDLLAELDAALDMVGVGPLEITS